MKRGGEVEREGRGGGVISFLQGWFLTVIPDLVQ